MPTTLVARPQRVESQAFRVWASCLLAILLLASGLGCRRGFYRTQADKEIDFLIAQKVQDLNWTMPRFPIQVDPRSRFFDPTNLDAPPMPPDDPVAHQYMCRVDGMKGWPCWETYGHWNELENPRWKEQIQDYTETTKDGALKLSLESAVRIGMINSADYRAQLETIMLSALDVSTERFRFLTQFFGNTATIFGANGDNGKPGTEKTNLTQNNNLALQKQFAAGGELIVGIANSFVWQFAGPDTNNANSVINFSFVQPLLRMAGRVFVMETLTIAERALLSNLRAMQRYRQGFFTNIAIGDNAGVVGPQRDGGFFGGTGLTGFTGTGSAGFGGVGTATNLGRQGLTTGGFGAAGGGAAGFAGGGAGLTGGYLGLLQQLQQVRNTQASLNAQVRTVGLLEANLEAGIIDIAQVDVFRQNIETERANLLTSQVTLANTLDNFKTTVLGLPPNLPVVLDDAMIQQFRLVDPHTTALQDKIEDFITLLGDLPEVPTESMLRRGLSVLGTLRDKLADSFTAAHRDINALLAKVPERETIMTAKQRARFQEDLKALDDGLEELEKRYADSQEALQQLSDSMGADNTGAAAERLVSLSTTLSGMTQELSLLQARARLETVTASTLTITPQCAMDIARANRLDWMNNRVNVTDTWRLVAFNANQLKSGLSITFNGNLGTFGNNPAKLSGKASNLTAGLRFDGPFTRRTERNNFRQSLINYQQSRRQLIQFQDGIYQNLRRYLRTLEQYDRTLEIQRRAVVIAVRRVDQTRETLSQPPEPVEPGQIPSQLGPTSAQNLLTALSDLRNAQNNFMSIWLNHYETRALIMREMGILEIDENGMWVDRPLNVAEWLDEDPCPLPPPVPKHWLKEVDLEPESAAEELPPGATARNPQNDEPVRQELFPVPAEDQKPPEDEPRRLPRPQPVVPDSSPTARLLDDHTTPVAGDTSRRTSLRSPRSARSHVQRQSSQVVDRGPALLPAD